MPPPRWSRAWRTGGWIRLLSGTTCSASTAEDGVGRWISSWRDSPASPPRSPGDAAAWETRAGSGLTSPESWLTWPQQLSFLRTSPDSSASTAATASPRSWVRWPRSGSMRAGVCTAQPRSALPIAASASSSWESPREADGGPRGSSAGFGLRDQTRQWQTPATDSFRSRGGARKSGVMHPGTTLTDAARLWPTPAAQDDNKTPEAHMAMKQRMKGGPRSTVTSLQVEVQLWATPKSALSGPDFARQEARKETHGSGADDLVTQIARWSTPTSRDFRHPQDLPNRHGSPSLPQQIDRLSRPDPATGTDGARSSSAGPTSRPRLNARFAEWLMGLPEGFASPEPMNSAPSATAWCRSQRRWLSSIFSA